MFLTLSFIIGTNANYALIYKYINLNCKYRERYIIVWTYNLRQMEAQHRNLGVLHSNEPIYDLVKR